MTRAVAFTLAFGVAVAVAFAAPAEAQRPTPPRRELPRADAQTIDSLRADSLRADSLAQDSANSTARYLKAQQRAEVRISVFSRLGAESPQPPLSRTIVTRDSIDWAGAATVSDLLARVPGVYLWRGGWIGRPELPNYQARGSTAAEYYLDGVPYIAAGVDSVAVDPSLFALSFLERVEIERWPGLLRVRLYTRRHDRLAPRSRLGVATGDADFARYLAAFERRSRAGIGFVLAADYLNTGTLTGSASGFRNSQIWLQGSYLRSPRFGVQYQLIRMNTNRAAFVPSNGSEAIGAGFNAKRTDAQLRLMLRRRTDGFGPGLDLIYARTGWNANEENDIALKQQVNQLGGVLSLRQPTSAVSLSGMYRTRWTPLDVRLAGGWAPGGLLSASADAGYQRHRGGRSSQWVGGRVGWAIARDWALSAAGRLGSIVAAPSLLLGPAQTIRDVQAALGWQRRRVGFELAVAHTAGFQPPSYQPFFTVPSIGAAPSTNWFTASGRIAPLQWLTLESWYSSPLRGVREGLPPKHSVSTATIRSKFLRTFPSGIFDLKLQLALENWGAGIIGRDASGAPQLLPSATFFRSSVQVAFGSLQFYWDRTNLAAARRVYVPGFPIPAYAQTIGLRWDFLN